MRLTIRQLTILRTKHESRKRILGQELSSVLARSDAVEGQVAAMSLRNGQLRALALSRAIMTSRKKLEKTICYRRFCDGLLELGEHQLSEAHSAAQSIRAEVDALMGSVTQERMRVERIRERLDRKRAYLTAVEESRRDDEIDERAALRRFMR